MEVRMQYCGRWVPVDNSILSHFWETTSVEEIAKCFRYLNKRIIVKLNTKFKLVRA